LVRDVKCAYTDLLLARERLRFAEEALLNRSNIAVLAEARLRAGDASEWETMTARVETLRVREEIKRLKHDATLAEYRLQNLIGLESAKTPCTFRDTPPQPQCRLTLEELNQQALVARPDLRAAELGIEIAGKRAGLASAEIFALAGALNAKGSETYGMMYGPALSLPVPIFSQNQGATARAKAELEQAAWNYIKVRDRILLEVKEARVKFQQAAEDWQTWQVEILTPLKEAAAAAIKAYEGGETSYLAVLEANRQLLTAEMRAAEVLADLYRAAADLDRSVGSNCAAIKPAAANTPSSLSH
jgi:cobalt-zinc-cadmium efflux system outer membrane protein